MPAPAKTTQSLFAQLRHLPISIAGDLEKLFDEHPVTTAADLQIVATFINAAQALAALPQYRTMQNEDVMERHCVRCHATYSNSSNGPEACTIPHVFATDPTFTGEVREEKVYSYQSRCCGSAVEVEEEGEGILNADELDWCYEGYHTTDVDEVEDEEEYNGVNIRRCKLDKKSGECVRTWIDDENPIWDWQID